MTLFLKVANIVFRIANTSYLNAPLWPVTSILDDIAPHMSVPERSPPVLVYTWGKMHIVQDKGTKDNSEQDLKQANNRSNTR